MAQCNIYTGVNGIARGVSKVYTGVSYEVPGSWIQITTSNISNYFNVSNDSYYFVGSGSSWTSNNKGVQSSTATTTLTAKQRLFVKFSYTVSSEANYDKLIITAPNFSDTQSGSVSKTASQMVVASGQQIKFQYSKDYSVDNNNDNAVISGFYVALPTGGGIARLVSKMYTGVNGIARQVFPRFFPISSSFTPATTIYGTPSYSYSKGTGSLSISLTSRKSTSSDYDANRNVYRVYINNIKNGDTVSFDGSDVSPPPSTTVQVYFNGTVIKKWSTYGNQTYSFTANGNGSLEIELTDGDWDGASTTVSFSITNFKINGNLITFS